MSIGQRLSDLAQYVQETWSGYNMTSAKNLTLEELSASTIPDSYLRTVEVSFETKNREYFLKIGSPKTLRTKADLEKEALSGNPTTGLFYADAYTPVRSASKLSEIEQIIIDSDSSAAGAEGRDATSIESPTLREETIYKYESTVYLLGTLSQQRAVAFLKELGERGTITGITARYSYIPVRIRRNPGLHPGTLELGSASQFGYDSRAF